MSLSTVLKIGKIYRNSTEYGMDEHSFVKKISDVLKAFSTKKKDANKKAFEPVIYSIPVRKNALGELEILLNQKEILVDEDRKKGLRYLNYKASAKDKEVTYIFGDIVFSKVIEEGKEKEEGNFRLKTPSRKESAFSRGKDKAREMKSDIIQEFSRAFEKMQDAIEKLLSGHPVIVLHFNFSGNHWYEQEGIFDAINEKLITEFVVEQKLPNGKIVFGLGKSLFKTIKTPVFKDGKFDDPVGVGAVTPGFRNTDSYKIRAFESIDEVIDLFYAIDTSERKPIVRINDNEIGIFALPNLEWDKHEVQNYNLLAKTLNNFFPKKGENNQSDYEKKEQKIQDDIKDDYDDIFQGFLENEFKEEIAFDIVFTKLAAGSSPSFDLVEISNVKKSILRKVHEQIRNEKQLFELLSDVELSDSYFKPAYNIQKSFLRVLGYQYEKKEVKGDVKTEFKVSPKYKSHLLKVIPKIYTDSYFEDPMLLPSFIEQVENGIRKNGWKYNVIKYDFYFLIKIQKYGDMKLKEITESDSYKIGILLGRLCKPFASWRKDCPIQSFEKSHIGQISRHIKSEDELCEVVTFVEEKLTMHKLISPFGRYKEQQESLEAFYTQIKEFKSVYHKNHCALGFFEGFYTKNSDDNE